MTRKKFVPLFAEGGNAKRMAVLLPGRNPCQCLAVRHRLIGNCTSCGRIVCEQEGSGPCYFCGQIVATTEERKLLEAGTNASRKYLGRLRSTPWAPGTPTPPYMANKKPCRRKRSRQADGKSDVGGENDFDQTLLEDKTEEVTMLASDDKDVENEDDDDDDDGAEEESTAQTRLEEGLVQALLQRDRLLNFDATSARRTRVIDDELDYFVSEGSGGTAAAWLDPQTRARVAKRVEELREQRRALRSQAAAFALTIDFANMTVSEQKIEAERPAPTEEDLDALIAQKQENAEVEDPIGQVGISDPLLNVPTPQFVSETFKATNTASTGEKPKTKTTKVGEESYASRVQDPDQQRNIDRGFCLSMHQPWASLLVRGIKIHEGRSWYSAHRGPLWIAAAAKQADEEEIRAVEDIYLERGARKEDFPTVYPTGVLVGRVNVDEVLPQKEYRLKFPNGESESPFVFVCSDPRELLIKLPMSGRHKIYRLDQRIHTSAKVNLT